MELKPNFDLLEFLRHQNYFTNHYNMKAAELSSETGKSVIRYADNLVVTPEYKNSVHTHINQVAYDFVKLFHITHDMDFSDISGKITIPHPAYSVAPVMVLFHDNGEKPFLEWQTAHSETDPEIQAALKAYPIAEMEMKTGLIETRVSLLAAHENNPRIYTDFIDECRDALDVKENYNGSGPSAEKILKFNQTAVAILDDKVIELEKYAKWHDPKLLAEYEFAKTHYTGIETVSTLDGALAKLGEKAEGSIYINRINQIKKYTGGRMSQHLPSYYLGRMATRYESSINTLWTKAAASNDDTYMRLAAGMTALCYITTRNTADNCKPYLSAVKQPNEPDMNAPDTVHTAFNLQMENDFIAQEQSANTLNPPLIHSAANVRALYEKTLDMMSHGTVHIPDKGKALFDSPYGMSYRVPSLNRSMINNILRAF